MTALLLALAASLPVAGLCWLAGALLDRNADRFAIGAWMREGLWSGLLVLPAAHVAAVVVGARLLPADLKTARLDLIPDAPAATAVLPEPGAAAATPPPVLPWPEMVLAVVALGAIVGLALLALRHLRLARLTARAVRCDRPDLIAAVGRRAVALGVGLPPLLTSPGITSPRLAGLLRPAILLPEGLAALPTDELALICGHELAHLKLRDNLRLVIEDVLLALFWFNPVMRPIRGRLAAAREEGRDDLALADAAPETRRRYAETLVQTLRLGAGPEPYAAFIGAGRNIAAMRLNAILKPRPPMSPRVAMTTVGLTVLLSLGVVACSAGLATAVGPAADETPNRGGMTVKAETKVKRDDGVDVFTGGVRVIIHRVTGDPDTDARGAGVTFLVDGQPAPVGFNPASIPPEQILRAELTERPQVHGRYQATVNIVRGTGTRLPQPDALPTAKPPAQAGSVDFIADEVVVAEGKSSYRGDVEVRVKPVTGKPWIDVRLAGAVFYVNGEPAPKSFDPASIDRKTVTRVDVTTRTTPKGRTYSMIDFIIGPAGDANAAANPH